MIILIGGDKGGTGKSHLAVNLAVNYSLTGSAVTVFTSDLNQTCVSFHERRVKQKNLKQFNIFEVYGSDMGSVTYHADLSDVVIMDCAGHDSQEFRAGLLVADVVIVPFNPYSCAEIDTLYKTSKIISAGQKRNPKLKARFLPCKVKPQHYAKEREVREDLQNDDDFHPAFRGRISDLTVYARAFNEGKGVHEINMRVSGASKAKGQIELLAEEIKQLLQVA